MNRRRFLAAAGFGVVSSPSVVAYASGSLESITVGEVNRYLRSLVDVAEPSVDRIIVGNSEASVTGIGTAWMPSRAVCQEALERGFNVLVAHEPTFFTHWDLEARAGDDYLGAPDAARSVYVEERERKREWLAEHGLNIIRCHDVIDQHPRMGVPFSFAEALGLARNRLHAARGYYQVYSVDEAPAEEIVNGFVRRLTRFGQDGAAFYGDPAYPVLRVGIGTGYASNPLDYGDLGADLFISIDDTIRTWVQGAFSDDSGRPLLIVNHGTTEEPAMAQLAEHLGRAFDSIPVEHIGTGCGYRWIRPLS